MRGRGGGVGLILFHKVKSRHLQTANLNGYFSRRGGGKLKASEDRLHDREISRGL